MRCQARREEGGRENPAVVITKLTPFHHPKIITILFPISNYFIIFFFLTFDTKKQYPLLFPILPSRFLPISHLITQEIEKYKTSSHFSSPASLFAAMNKAETSSMAEAESEDSETTTPTTHHLTIPPGLTQPEFQELAHSISEFHTYQVGPGQCSSLLAQRVHAPLPTLWSVVRRFDKPQTYKHFIKSCHVEDGFEMRVGCLRDVNVISGLPAETSTERLDILDDERHVTGFSIIGGEHRLRNYRSVTTVHEYQNHGGEIWTVVLESYVVDMPEGNTEEDTRLFADTVVKLNLQKLASVTEGMARDQVM